VSQILDKLKMKFGEWPGWKNNSCEILSWKNTPINLQDPKYTGVVGLSQEELQYVKGFFLWPIVKCTGKKQVAELGGARKLLGSRTPSLAAVARMPGIRRGIGIPKKSGNPMAAALGKTMSAAAAAAAGIQRKSGTAKKSLTTGSHLGKTMSAFIDKVAKDERYNSIKKLQKFAISEVKLKPMECSGRSVESKEPHAINGVKRICQSALGPRKKATDSPHAFKIPVVFKVTKCAKQKKCDVKIAGWGMFKDWRSREQQANDKLTQSYDALCAKYSAPILKTFNMAFPISESRKQMIANAKTQSRMCWKFRNAGWDSIVRDTIAEFRFEIARKA